jgi:putative endonuclease
MYYVYIIYSEKLNKKYIGFSTNLNKRIKEYNLGKSNFTSKGIPWKLIYYELFKSEKDARGEEIFLKSGKGGEKVKFLLEDTIGEFA